MRSLAVVGLVILAMTTAPALAKPKVAVAPIKGDKDDKVATLIVDALDGKAIVTGPKATAREMRELELEPPVEGTDAKRLRTKLAVAALVQGTLEKDGAKRKLEVLVVARGKKPSTFTIRYKTMPSKDDRRELRAELLQRLEGAEDAPDADEEDDKITRAMRAREEKKAEKRAEKKPEKKSKKKKKRVADDDDEELTDEEVEEANDSSSKRDPKLRAARVAAGASYGLRRLTYTADMPPPRVGTTAPAGRVEGELYLVVADLKGALARLGLAAHYDKTFGLSIQVPGTTTKAAIDQAEYGIGLRYQIPIGAASRITLGLDYARRKYVADRSALMNPGDLDAPDVNYKAFETGVAAETPVAKTAMLFGGIAGLLVRDTGGIQQSDQYGGASVLGVTLDGGVDLMLSKQLYVRLGLEYTQINFKFNGNGTLAMQRGVTNATDRYVVGAATLGVSY
ncbi:MAG TPA: hypothetical protein VFQ53_43310 [Kofleriaceae bacterium]|nr:hypothetical protein [Kofleriaceae bacterium]